MWGRCRRLRRNGLGFYNRCPAACWSETQIPLRGAAKRLVRARPNVGAGPADLYTVEGTDMRVGLIRPVSRPFCDRCNRLRLSADGKLRSCLIEGGEVDLREMLRGDSNSRALTGAFWSAAKMKPRLHSGCGETVMRSVGG